MPDVGAIASSTAATTSVEGTSKNMSDMDAEDFLQLLIAQLQQQDPMNPMSNEAMVEQMATIRDMEMSYTLTETLKQMTEEQRFAGAAGLIGKYVVGEVEDAEGETATLEGVVTGIRFSASGKAILELDTGEVLPLAKMKGVMAEPPLTEEESVRDAVKLAKQANGSAPSAAPQAPSLGSLATFGLTNDNGLNLGLTLG